MERHDTNGRTGRDLAHIERDHEQLARPEIDGQVYLSGTEMLDAVPKPGQLITVRVEQASDYDLAGQVIAAAASEPLMGRRVSLRVLPSDNRALR